MAEGFVLHGRLAADTVELARWPLSLVLLMNDRRWPWLILVPRRPAAREIHALDKPDRDLLMDEIAAAGAILEDMVKPKKINVGALGNLVPQLHVHIVARQADDPAWPGPVWGFGPRAPYADAALREVLERMRQALDGALAGLSSSPDP